MRVNGVRSISIHVEMQARGLHGFDALYQVLFQYRIMYHRLICNGDPQSDTVLRAKVSVPVAFRGREIFDEFDVSGVQGNFFSARKLDLFMPNEVEDVLATWTGMERSEVRTGRIGFSPMEFGSGGGRHQTRDVSVAESFYLNLFDMR
jgi:hypothetical protein